LSLEYNDKQQEQPTPSTNGAGEHAPSTPAPATDGAYGHHKPILAERIFDWSAYGVWNYGIQTGASVLAGMWFRSGSGKPLFEKSAEWLGDNIVSKLSSKRGAAAANVVRTPLVFAALITVGNLFIPPIQYAERRKEKIVSWINDKINDWRTARGDAPTDAELKEQQAAIAAIATEPHQTSASLWGGRAVGLTANVAASLVVGTERNAVMEEAVANTISKGLKTVGANKLAASERVREFSRIAFLDYGYSIISASMLYLYSHFIHPPKAHDEAKTATPAPSAGEPPQPSILPQRKDSLTPRPELLSGSTITPSEALHDHALAH
jgi:hypothetical protein